MSRIQQLPPEVVTKIAAGEVIERPASAVKEMLENSVDAGATRIDIAVDQGGSERIEIVDDGEGILPEDLPLAFASHATSKLRTADDLFRVQTLGFRGEALASIGGVAQVSIQSRSRGADLGAEITCHGGQVGPVRPWNGAAGTRIEVRHLFFNTPVRRQFLRSVGTEMGHIAEAVTRLALAHPTLHLKLTHNNRLVFEVPGAAGLRERISLFFGGDLAARLLPVEASHGPARLFGYAADPSCDRGNPRLQYFFLNGRWIRDRALGHALQEAYRGLIMVGRYCVAFLFLELPPDLVDVNVHPTKSEVRFRDAQALYHLVLGAVRETLGRADLTAAFHAPPAAAGAGRFVLTPPLSVPPPPARPAETGPPPPGHETNGRGEASRAAPDSPPSPGPLADAAGPPPGAKVLQLYDSYLVAETPEGMLLIDQHALHERILYEQWKARIREGGVECQRLLVPEPVDLPVEQAALAVEHRDVLGSLGLGVEDFGRGTVLVTSYPAIVRRLDPAELLRTALEFLAGSDRLPTAEQLLDDLLRLMSCKAAIKAGDHLSPEEIASLMAHRHLADHTHHCPHGRPTALLFSKQELDRQFKRV